MSVGVRGGGAAEQKSRLGAVRPRAGGAPGARQASPVGRRERRRCGSGSGGDGGGDGGGERCEADGDGGGVGRGRKGGGGVQKGSQKLVESKEQKGGELANY